MARKHDYTYAIECQELAKAYGGVTALRSLDLAVPPGSVLGVLGPNGAGKTTAVRIFATLLLPDSGCARVAGLDVVERADSVRHLIGLSGQYAAVDERLTGRENLVMVGRLHRMSARAARARAAELLEGFELSHAADRITRTYSGGMRRRLDLAASLITSPDVIFLDEPTTGLDPKSRQALWEGIRGLARGGTTLLLTTQYLEEADTLADDIVIIEHGRVVAHGTSDQLKARTGGERLEVLTGHHADLAKAAAALKTLGDGEVRVDEETHRLSVPVREDSSVLVKAVRELDAAGVEVHDLKRRTPTLDEAFLSLTGRPLDESGPESTATDDLRKVD